MQDCKSVASPMEPGLQLAKGEEDFDPETPIRELIESLIFLASVSRPHIAMVVSLLSQFYTCYTKEQSRHAMRVFLYSRGKTFLGIKYARKGNESMVYSDRYFAGDREPCVSRTGTLVLLKGDPVVWLSQKRQMNTLSSTEV